MEKKYEYIPNTEGEKIEIPTHPDGYKVWEKVATQGLEAKLTRRELFGLTFLWIASGVKIIDIFSSINAYVDACKLTTLRNRDKVSFTSQGCLGWDDKNTLELIGPDSGSGQIETPFLGSPMRIHRKRNGEEVVMVRVVYGKNKLGIKLASWHEAQSLHKVEPQK